MRRDGVAAAAADAHHLDAGAARFFVREGDAPGRVVVIGHDSSFIKSLPSIRS